MTTAVTKRAGAGGALLRLLAAGGRGVVRAGGAVGRDAYHLGRAAASGTYGAGAGLARGLRGGGAVAPPVRNPLAPAFQAGQAAGAYGRGVGTRLGAALGVTGKPAPWRPTTGGRLLQVGHAAANPLNWPRMAGRAVDYTLGAGVLPQRLAGHAAAGLGSLTTAALKAPGEFLAAAVPRFAGAARYAAEPLRRAVSWSPMAAAGAAAYRSHVHDRSRAVPAGGRRPVSLNPAPETLAAAAAALQANPVSDAPARVLGDTPGQSLNHIKLRA